MQISRRSADRYRKALDAIGGEAVRDFGRALDYYRRNNPDASVAEYRDFAIYIAEQIVREYGGASSRLSADLFDLIMESEGFPGIEAETIDPVNHERIEGAVRRHAGHLAKETPDYPAFKRGCSGLVRNESRAAANDTVAHNVEKANSKRGRGSGKVRYAVVPTKALPCAYCAMLASRGFVYRSQETAETSTHRDCTCAFLPGIEGKTTVEGYDPEHYVDVWQNHWKYEELKKREGVGSKRDPHPENPAYDIIFSDKQFGEKMKRHCKDWGLDQRIKEDRDEFQLITYDIIYNADDVAYGEWRGQEGLVTFYIKGNDVVVVNSSEEYVTTMKGGATNGRVVSARDKNQE